jgi:hypothetical protein
MLEFLLSACGGREGQVLSTPIADEFCKWLGAQQIIHFIRRRRRVVIDLALGGRG